MAHKERDVLPDLRDKVEAESRDELGLQWLQFHDEHEGAPGLTGKDKDPEAFVKQHSSG